MDAATLIYKTNKGTLGSIVGTRLDPLIEAAKQARVTGKIGKDVVERGVVMATWRTRPAYDFIAEKPQPEAPAVKPKV